MDASLTPWLWILVFILVTIGLAGTVLPMLPGAPMVFGGLWLAAWIDGYSEVGPWTVAVLGVLVALAIAMDFVASALGAQRVGASRQAIVGSVLGSVVGIFFGLLGLLVGPFVGAVIGELMARRNVQQATTVGVATWIGLLFGTIAKLALSLAMIGVFLFAYLL
jgi:uncharacterized protein YqgC (DUF456 family)